MTRARGCGPEGRRPGVVVAPPPPSPLDRGAGLLYHSGGFLNSTLVVPLVALTLACFLELRRQSERALLAAVLLMIAVNNAAQVGSFREALAGLG